MRVTIQLGLQVNTIPEFSQEPCEVKIVKHLGFCPGSLLSGAVVSGLEGVRGSCCWSSSLGEGRETCWDLGMKQSVLETNAVCWLTGSKADVHQNSQEIGHLKAKS